MKKSLTVAVIIFAVGLLLSCVSANRNIQKSREKDPRYQYNVGLFYLNQNSPDEAIKYFVRSLALEATNHLVWNALGLAHSLKGNLQESAKAFEKCLELNPQFTEARNNLGTIYQELNYLAKAEEEFKKVIFDKAYTSKELGYYNLARLYFIQDRLDEAYENIENAIQIRPRLAMAYNLRGLILEQWERLPEAISSYEQAVRIVPEDVLFNFNLASAYFKVKEYSLAREIFMKISLKATSKQMKDSISNYLKMISEIKQKGAEH